MENILFYKYVVIEDPEKLKQDLLDFSNEIGLKGKILLAKEGINGNVTGDSEQINQFLEYMRADKRFSDVDFKKGDTHKHNFKRMLVKIRKEIISTRFGADITNKAPYIEPEELKELYESGEEFFIVDTRNDYEFDVGHFKDAIELPITTFQDFPLGVKAIKHLKDKQVITYCTGGVRCEKATAYLVQQGFKNVKQLHGGIVKYGEEVGGDYWEGKCFVFDERGSIDLEEQEEEELKVLRLDKDEMKTSL